MGQSMLEHEIISRADAPPAPAPNWVAQEWERARTFAAAFPLRQAKVRRLLETARKQGKCRFTGFSSHDRPWIKMMIETGMVMPLVGADCEFVAPAAPGDHCEVRSRILRSLGFAGVGNAVALAAGLALPSVILMMIFGITKTSAITASKGAPASRSAASFKLAADWTSKPAPVKWD